MNRQPYPPSSGGYQQQQGAYPRLPIGSKVPPLDSKQSFETQESIKSRGLTPDNIGFKYGVPPSVSNQFPVSQHIPPLPLIQPQPRETSSIYGPHGIETIQDLSHQSTTQWCPKCGRTVNTTVKYKASIFTYCWFLVLCLTLVCCWVPCVINKCKNANHYCPECGGLIGTHDGSCC